MPLGPLLPRRRCHRTTGPGPIPPRRTPRGTRVRSATRGAPPRLVSVLDFAAERTHFNRERCRASEPVSPLECDVQVWRLDDREAADVLLALDEWAVGHEDIAILRTNDGRRARRMQT